MKKSLLVLLVLVTIITCTTSCAKPQQDTSSNSTPEPTITSEPDSAPIKGAYVETTTIENVEGNYYIPIADSWIGKVSYEIDGTHTYFYHVTEDTTNQPEVYPVLLHINTSEDPSADSLGAEVFMDILGKQYYSIPRMDFPYNPNTTDAQEFEKLMLDIPFLLQSAWLIDDSEWQEHINQPAGNPTGDIVMSNYITPENPTYSVYIPDNWLYKVSFTTSANTIVFYHITKDPSELEINPVIMAIDFTYGGQDISVEETYESDGQTFYYTPRFDFPYSDDISLDGKEFAELYANAQTVLESCTLAPTTMYGHELAFLPSDAWAGRSWMSDTIDSVLSTISEQPISIDSGEYGATGETYEKYKYSFGTLSFTDGILSSADITSHSVYGPRGFSIGDNIDDIIQEFTTDWDSSNDDITIFYRRNADDDNMHTIIPSSGTMYKSSEGKTLTFNCFANDAEMEQYSIAELSDMYMYEYIYSCSFYFDEYDTMTSYSLFYGASAE